MSPFIASFFCVSFILSVLIVDIKNKPKISLSHWIPFIWFLILSSRPVAQWFVEGSSAATDLAGISGNTIDATILSILTIFGLIILSKRPKSCQDIIKINKWLIVLYLYCGISILWSDYPFVSFKRWIRSLGTLTMALVVLTETEYWETVKTMFRRCAFLIIPLSILCIKYYRSIGVYYGDHGGAEYCGVTTHKNLLGRLCFIFGFYFIWELFVNRKKDKKIDVLIQLSLLIMIFWLLRQANSATSLFSLILSIFMLTLLNFPIIKNNLRRLNVMVVCAFLVTGILYLIIGSDFLLNSLGRDTTFTGRTELWSLCFQYAGSPIIGVGYDSFWLGDRLKVFWDRYWWHPIQAHNGYIDAYLDLGIIGLIFISGIILSTYNKVKNAITTNFKIGSFQFIIFVIFLLNNITENAMQLSGLFWFTLLVLTSCNRNSILSKS